MRRIFTIVGLAVLFSAFSCSQSSQKAAFKHNGAAIEFETTEYDYGTIPYKGNGSYEFVFRNTGKEPLILKNVRSSCGCTVPEWPKDPIKKGDKGKIKVKYNTSVTGKFAKSVSVFSNASERPIVLVIKGKVEEAAKEMTTAPEKN